ncbi:hypothetical protein DPMN_118306 [Dreissena polymorpha]|uniref:Uncharacterized protein n=1 Tax=Dreissena polymorpha TaxID=45954 RepID=A0A9D4JQ43_DREPO|nr:hypothetical protein DPMN_118306 [Dreissena polymorpha]
MSQPKIKGLSALMDMVSVWQPGGHFMSLILTRGLSPKTPSTGSSQDTDSSEREPKYTKHI